MLVVTGEGKALTRPRSKVDEEEEEEVQVV